MQVTKWTDWHDFKYADFFNGKHTQEDIDEAIGCIAATLRGNGYAFSGFYHQYGAKGVPVIDDKYAFRVSQRQWGKVMVEAYDLMDNDGLGYVTWAWMTPEGEVTKTPEEIY